MSRSQRLTNDLRDTINKNMQAKLFTNRENAVRDKLRALALKVWGTLYTVGELAYIDRDPGEFLSRAVGIDVSIDGQRRIMDFGKAMPFANRDLSRYTQVTLLPGTPLREEYDVLTSEREKIRAEKKALARTLKDTLNNITTTKKLFEVWPDAEQYLPKVEDVYLPAIPVSNLTDLIAELQSKA